MHIAFEVVLMHVPQCMSAAHSACAKLGGGSGHGQNHGKKYCALGSKAGEKS